MFIILKSPRSEGADAIIGIVSKAPGAGPWQVSIEPASGSFTDGYGLL